MSPAWHLFKHELRRNRRQAIAWTVIVAGLVVLYALLLPSIAESGDSLASMLEAYPDGLLKALNMEDAAMSATPLGFHVTQSGFAITILGGIFAASLGANLLLRRSVTAPPSSCSRSRCRACRCGPARPPPPSSTWSPSTP